ncbi:MAG: hypothetical protein HKM04_11705 [Legionellales bacterium]|nr:hypothetical protein [Legionellales bacterium]
MYETDDIERVIDGLRVFGQKDTAQIKTNWGDGSENYENLHVLSDSTKLVYWTVPSSQSLYLGGTDNVSPEQLFLNIKNRLDIARDKGIRNNCTFSFTIHCGLHFIPLNFQIKNNQASVLVVDTYPGYEQYIQQATLAIETKQPLP